jgi:hypothetical protein
LLQLAEEAERGTLCTVDQLSGSKVAKTSRRTKLQRTLKRNGTASYPSSNAVPRVERAWPSTINEKTITDFTRWFKQKGILEYEPNRLITPTPP